MLSSMPVIRSAAEDARLPKLGWRKGREKRNHPVAQDGVEGGCTAQHTHTGAECLLALSYTHSIWRHASILKLLSVGLPLWHAPWDGHEFYYDECKWNLFFCMSDTVAWTLWGNDTPQQPPHPSITHIFQQQHRIRDLDSWSNQFALDEKQISSNCDSIR